MTIETVFSEIVRKILLFQNCGRIPPIWIKEQVNGVLLLESDIDRGLQVLASGLQGERDALDKAVYKPYRGDVHG